MRGAGSPASQRFYDVKLLLDAQELDRPIFNGFIAYLLSHNRPLAEVLNPRWKDIAEPFYREFSGMTFETIATEELTAVPNRMIAALKSCFTQQDVDFYCHLNEANQTGV